MRATAFPASRRRAYPADVAGPRRPPTTLLIHLASQGGVDPLATGRSALTGLDVRRRFPMARHGILSAGVFPAGLLAACGFASLTATVGTRRRPPDQDRMYESRRALIRLTATSDRTIMLRRILMRPGGRKAGGRLGHFAPTARRTV